MTDQNDDGVRPADRVKELLYCWFSSRFDVLVPKKRGEGYLRVPLGHHHDKALGKIAATAGCDIFGLYGNLSFDCKEIAVYDDRHASFVRKVMPALEAHYGMPSREVTAAEFWEKHPFDTSGAETHAGL